MQVDIVSAEQAIFSGPARMLFASGILGELGIAPQHTQLLTLLKPGQVRILTEQGNEEIYYVSGGILEVQPYVVTILADTALRAADIDEAAAHDAKFKAEQTLKQAQGTINYSQATAELSKAAAQLAAIYQLKKSRDRIS